MSDINSEPRLSLSTSTLILKSPTIITLSVFRNKFDRINSGVLRMVRPEAALLDVSLCLFFYLCSYLANRVVVFFPLLKKHFMFETRHMNYGLDGTGLCTFFCDNAIAGVHLP